MDKDKTYTFDSKIVGHWLGQAGGQDYLLTFATLPLI